jgi:hypothetical protein
MARWPRRHRQQPTLSSVIDAFGESPYGSWNVPYEQLSWRFCARGRFTADGLNSVLDELILRDLLVRDGPTTHGVHYALTSKGKAQLQRQQLGRAA